MTTTLPADPMMLFSTVNTLLRDAYPSIDELCSALDISREHLEQRLAEAGFEYNPSQNKFW